MLYPGVSLGTPVKAWFIYGKKYIVIYLNRLADTDIHKVFNSKILSEMFKLNVWEGVDALTFKIWLKS